MLGVVLCGGQSTRMGSDKGLMHHASLTWAALHIRNLAECTTHTVLSVNDHQYISYSEKFQALATIVKDDETLEIYGPLRGILSVHLKFPFDDLLVLACDMPLMQVPVLHHLSDTSSTRAEDAFVFKTDEQVEPLCAVYKAKGLAKTYRRYRQGHLEKHSMHSVLENMETCYLPINEEWKKCFTNFNAPGDLNAL